MTELRTDFISGAIQENPLASGTTTLIMSGKLQSLPTVASPDIAKLIIDPAGTDVLGGSGSEIVYVTAYTSGAASATILRGQESTTAKAHSQNTTIIHAPTSKDFNYGSMPLGAEVTGSGNAAQNSGIQLGGTTGSIAVGLYSISTGSPIMVFDHLATSNTGEWRWRNGSTPTAVGQLTSGGSWKGVAAGFFGTGALGASGVYATLGDLDANTAQLQAIGTNTHIGLNLVSQNSGEIKLTAGSVTGIRVGNVASATAVAFHNTSPINKPTVSGSKGANAALASLMTALANYGLVTDTTT